VPGLRNLPVGRDQCAGDFVEQERVRG
jgi:hypothetical protein